MSSSIHFLAILEINILDFIAILKSSAYVYTTGCVKLFVALLFKTELYNPSAFKGFDNRCRTANSS